ncbi:hypothetical protein BBJ28_00008014 [Nothophytophthora sp. Chile5]|nr:hypothetical protein BBJ28_00008014 [Nothophytophthora sp. Chile5]
MTAWQRLHSTVLSGCTMVYSQMSSLRRPPLRFFGNDSATLAKGDTSAAKATTANLGGCFSAAILSLTELHRTLHKRVAEAVNAVCGAFKDELNQTVQPLIPPRIVGVDNYELFYDCCQRLVAFIVENTDTTPGFSDQMDCIILACHSGASGAALDSVITKDLRIRRRDRNDHRNGDSDSKNAGESGEGIAVMKSEPLNVAGSKAPAISPANTAISRANPQVRGLVNSENAVSEGLTASTSPPRQWGNRKRLSTRTRMRVNQVPSKRVRRSSRTSVLWRKEETSEGEEKEAIEHEDDGMEEKGKPSTTTVQTAAQMDATECGQKVQSERRVTRSRRLERAFEDARNDEPNVATRPAAQMEATVRAQDVADAELEQAIEMAECERRKQLSTMPKWLGMQKEKERNAELREHPRIEEVNHGHLVEAALGDGGMVQLERDLEKGNEETQLTETNVGIQLETGDQEQDVETVVHNHEIQAATCEQEVEAIGCGQGSKTDERDHDVTMTTTNQRVQEEEVEVADPAQMIEPAERYHDVEAAQIQNDMHQPESGVETEYRDATTGTSVTETILQREQENDAAQIEEDMSHLTRDPVAGDGMFGMSVAQTRFNAFVGELGSVVTTDYSLMTPALSVDEVHPESASVYSPDEESVDIASELPVPGFCDAGMRSPQQTRFFKTRLRKSIKFVDALLCKPPPGKRCSRNCKSIRARRCDGEAPCHNSMCRIWHDAEAHTERCKNPLCEFKNRIVLREIMHQIEHQTRQFQVAQAQWEEESREPMTRLQHVNASKHEVDLGRLKRDLDDAEDELDSLKDARRILLANLSAIGVKPQDDRADGFPDFDTHYKYNGR